MLDHKRDHAWRWAAVVSVAGKVGCAAQTVHEWVKKTEVDSGVCGGVPSEVAAQLRALRGCRICDPRVGRLVQSSAVAQTHRQHPARRIRGALLCEEEQSAMAA